MAYTTWGSIRGGCNHVHDTEDQAVSCMLHDQHACGRSGGYSDRKVRLIDSPEDLTSYDTTRGPGTRHYQRTDQSTDSWDEIPEE